MTRPDTTTTTAADEPSRPLREFFASEAASGAAVLLAAVLALVLANTAARTLYEAVWGYVIDLSFGGLHLRHDLRHWVNDGLMTFFFLVVGLEIKREVTTGELRSARRSLVPVAAAIGGMVVPAAVYLAFAGGGEAGRGWGIPMATDIAFTLGVLAVLGSRVPASLRAFLLTLAIADDIGAILVIAVVYSSGGAPAGFAAAAAAIVATLVARRFGVSWIPVYVCFGVIAWVGLSEAGVHPTLTGVAFGLLAPAVPGVGREPIIERLEHLLHPWSAFFVVPVFALANAGVRVDGASLRAAAGEAVTLAVAAGLVVGKLLGVSLGTFLAVRFARGVLPAGVGPRHVVGAAALAGIGFTVSLFVTDLAFDAPALKEAAKVGVLGGSLVAGVLGVVILWGSRARA